MCVRDRGIRSRPARRGDAGCLLYTSDAAAAGLDVDLGRRRYIKNYK